MLYIYIEKAGLSNAAVLFRRKTETNESPHRFRTQFLQEIYTIILHNIIVRHFVSYCHDNNVRLDTSDHTTIYTSYRR